MTFTRHTSSHCSSVTSSNERWYATPTLFTSTSTRPSRWSTSRTMRCASPGCARTPAKRLAQQLAGDGIAAIYASDLARARETAEILGERLGLPVVVDPDLREKNWGTWEGLTSDERLHVEFEGEATEAHRERVLRA